MTRGWETRGYKSEASRDAPEVARRLAGTQDGAAENREWKALGGVQHPTNAVEACNVGDLVGITDDRRGSAWDDCAGELCGSHQGAFEVNMSVDQTRDQEST